MKQAKFRSRTLQSATLLVAMLAACGGPSSKVGAIGSASAKPELLSVDLGRLVDVYAYQRIDESVGDRRLRFNRKLVRVAQNIVVNPNIETQTLFDAGGEEVPSATYEFRSFDKNVGHEELVILWDNRSGPEEANFKAALQSAQEGLPSLAAAYRGQNTTSRPIPIVPRNAAIRLNFSNTITVDEEFFRVNPSAIQLLEFKGDPNVVDPVNAFRILSSRIIPQGTHIILDTTILGGEGASGFTTPGLPASTDSVTANIRIAIPSRGRAAASFYVKEDGISDLNGPDSAGVDSVVRDFRSGNLSDGASGKLFEAEAPMIVASLPMGITAIDAGTRTITLNKRLHFVPVRGRYPFVEGPLSSSGLPLGPVSVPVSQPLRSGDILTQTIQVLMPNGTLEAVTLRAEILQNLDIGTEVGGPLPLGLSANTNGGQEQGQMATEARVRVSSLEGGLDSLGRAHSFEANTTNVEGQDCVLRAVYYENVPFIGSTMAVSDAAWRHEFLRIDPQPTGVGGTLVNPVSSVAIEFTKPMDLDQVDNLDNLLITNMSVATETFTQQMGDPKKATARVVPTRLSDVAGDGTVLRLQAPMGLFHAANVTETYCVHVKLGTGGASDLAGNSLKLFDDPTSPLDSWSVDFRLDPAAPANLVGWHAWLFNDADEDGSLPGSTDIFGQFRLQGGRLYGAAGVRFSRDADSQNLQTISRIDGGECWDPAADSNEYFNTNTRLIPADQNGAPHPGLLYWAPKMISRQDPPAVPQVYEYWQSLPQNVGRVIEPHNPHGSRMQMRYIEDDFSLDRRQPAEMGIDVEQLYWSPFNDETIFYDVFDRYTMSLAHSGRRPDIRYWLNPDAANAPNSVPFCQFVCAAMNSSLSNVFSENVLPGTTAVPVFEDKVYKINPNEAFRSSFNVKYVPFPRFDRSYTWRDSRLVTIDASGQVIGLGGARQPNAPAPNNDMTADIDSPWVADLPDPEWVTVWGGTKWNLDSGDFRGDRAFDHDPIALPLVVDWKVFADSAANGVASGANSFQVAMLGPPADLPLGNPGGYYDSWPAGCGFPSWPHTRVQASGGEDLITGAAILIDPANTLSAQQSILKDAGLGNPTRALFAAPAGDGMMNWARADFVRKVSMMTFGFIDTLKPQMAQFVNDPAGTPVVVASDGFPNLAAISTDLRIQDIVTQIDPPQIRQPAGTSVVLEMRGAESFVNNDRLYNPSYGQAGQVADDTMGTRGNLLNPNYACEAFRYSQANSTPDGSGSGDNPRILTGGLTRYVTEDQVNLIRDTATGLLPRYMNVRLTMENNVSVSPALSPSLRSMTIVYRLVPNQ
ncbi:MAG: hypothetical protein IT456_00690 [Planctomycetes bacterium]|jgi:hypothetical protein|nr:hypothetical protein [Planctomycetota bacterium]